MFAQASLLLLLLAVSQSPASASDYDVCPNFVDCFCSPNENSITTPSKEGALESCLSFLHQKKLLRFKQLEIKMENKNLSLRENLLKDIQFDEVFVYEANIIEFNENFLGATRETVQDVNILGSNLKVFPKINSSSLVRLLTQDTSLLDIPGDAFQLTPQVKEIKIISTQPKLTINSGALEPLTHLETFYLRGVQALHLAKNAAKISSAAFKLFDAWGTLSAEPGAFSGFTSGSALNMEKYDGLWSRDIFYDLLAAGATISTRDAQPCDCDFAWIRHSNFLPQVEKVRCHGHTYPVSPSSMNFSTCPI
ncbi:uncharacterized protein LOC108674406 isoform X3 [Hyalella azteca]|uniref:Uncharacterized protein LOC108674406 isoform X2 n=1 Tax=Hyalella azteca TaxID=294128 RepID=A0A8B7NY85_HYAAZ|nr:uncharacterized protein LOC108674406 isoform X2 [Hyalella azteca]XP_047738215.1 uncharacterized protein LOC108674406 isoform X3 [Hyalella azteca]